MLEFFAGAEPFLKVLALGLANILFGLGCNYMKKKTDINLSIQQEKQLWEMAKRFVFQVEEKSGRLKKSGSEVSSQAKAYEAVSNLAAAGRIERRKAETFVDAVLAETGAGAAGKGKK